MMRQLLVLCSFFVLAGCYSEDVYPINLPEPHIVEVDLSDLEYAYSIEKVDIYPDYGAPATATIKELMDDEDYIYAIYGELEVIQSEEDLLVYLDKRLQRQDMKVAVLYQSEEAPAAIIEEKYKLLMNTHDLISATLMGYTYGIEKTDEGFFIDFYNKFTTDSIQYAYIEQEMDRIIEEINVGSLSELEKVEVLYQYVMDRMEYVDGGLLEHHSPYGFIMNGEGVCQAYAVSLHMLLERAGIESRYIIGTIHDDWLNEGESGAHAWNMVKLDGNWYHLDSTWDDDKKEWEYFLLSDTGMSFSRSWEKQYYPTADVPYEK